MNEPKGKRMSSEIKPCPFCGGKAEVLYTGKYECFIRCRRGCAEQTRLYKMKGSAIKAWNRRKPEDDVS